jgi:exodeoxyribonuclease V alpha subunit
MDVCGEFVIKAVHSSLERGCIFSAVGTDGAVIRVKYNWPKGQALSPVNGEAYSIKGMLGSYTDNWKKTHSQIVARTVERVRTSGALIMPWLQSLPNVGEIRANKLRAVFGDSLASVLTDPSRVEEVATAVEQTRPKLAVAIAHQIYAAVAKRNADEGMAKAEIDFMQHLEGLGVTDSRVARRMWSLLGGGDWQARLERNPYLAAHLMNWQAADHIGRRLLRAQLEREHQPVHERIANHPVRQLGALASCWREVLAQGHTAATPEDLESLLERRDVDPQATIALGLESRVLGQSEGLLRPPGAAWLEDDLARMLNALEAASPQIEVPTGTALHRLVDAAEASTGLRLVQEQHDAVVEILGRPLAVLRGGAGSGKTTTMKVLVACWEHLGGNVLLGALSGKASLELSRGASSRTRIRTAYTIARIVRVLKGSENASEAATQLQLEGIEQRERPFQLQSKTLLILDEASMIDTPSLHRLVAQLPPGARLLLVGDEGQLPPVDIGKVYHDLVIDGTRVLSLKQQHRQGRDSPITTAANVVREGGVPDIPSWAGQEGGIFLAEPPVTAHQVYETLKKFSQDVLVVAALRKTVVDLNELAGRARRPANCDLVKLSPSVSVAVDDPVVCTQNRYKDGLINGLIGRVTDLEDEVKILWDGENVPRILSHDAYSDIELAYALTCHKAQGSAAKHVIVMIEKSAIVTREWLYTAMTRSRETAVLVGEAANIAATIARREKRVTGFHL